MTYYRVTVNEHTYEVGVEEIGGTSELRSVQAFAPAPAGVPVLSTTPASVPVSSTPEEEPVQPKADSTCIVLPKDALDIMAPLPGTVVSVNVTVGDQVKSGQILLIFEAMKMENELVAPRDGTVVKVSITKGDTLESGKSVITIA